MADRGGGAFYCAGDKVESMEGTVDLSECGMGEIVAHKLNGVRKRSDLVTASDKWKQR